MLIAKGHVSRWLVGEDVRVSIATCQDRICPRFDRADTLIVIDVRDGREEKREVVDISAWAAHGRAPRLAKLGVDQLVCGALSSFDEAGFDGSRVRLVSRVAGPVDAVIRAILSGVVYSGQDYWPDRDEVRARELQRRRGMRLSPPTESEHRTGDTR